MGQLLFFIVHDTPLPEMIDKPLRFEKTSLPHISTSKLGRGRGQIKIPSSQKCLFENPIKDTDNEIMKTQIVESLGSKGQKETCGSRFNSEHNTRIDPKEGFMIVKCCDPVGGTLDVSFRREGQIFKLQKKRLR